MTKAQKKTSPNPVDIYVGSRLRLRRSLLGLSQEKLADALGLTFQQVQKYERGSNRVSASRLYELSKILEVPVSFFFEELDSTTAGNKVAEGQSDTWSVNLLEKKETIDLVRNYYKIKNLAARKKVMELIKTLGSIHGENDGE